MPTALVTGATGILGRAIVEELGREKNVWPTVYALSRSQKLEWPANVQTKQLDLLSSAQDMAEALADLRPDIIFFTAYFAQDTEEKATQVNGDMLLNFLSALEITGAAKNVKRVVLTTGAKQYGVHLGRPKNPCEESDRWLQDGWPPNFYYRQQEILEQKGKEQGFDWVVTYPNEVIGVAKNNYMNLATSLGIYCAVTKELGENLLWPGSPDFYSRFNCFISSTLHAKFNLWAALEQNARVSNQAFNVVNGDVESWSNLWPKLAKKFDMKIPETMFTPDEAEGKFDNIQSSVMPLLDQPPLAEFAAERGLKNTKFVQGARVEALMDMVKWSQRSDVKDAWSNLAKREGLEQEAFEKATFGFLTFVLGRNFDVVISMSKARKAGWTGYQDTWDSLSSTLDALAAEKILPRFTPRRKSSAFVSTEANSKLSLLRRRD